MALDFDPDVIGLSCQPFRVSWQRDGEDCSHTPDIGGHWARLSVGRLGVPAGRGNGSNAGIELALAGWLPPSPVHGRWPGRQPAAGVPGPFSADGWGQAGRRPDRGAAVLYHLLWTHVLAADLDSAPLSA